MSDIGTTFFLHKVFVTLGISFFIMAKLHFRPYIPNSTVLFPQRIDGNITANVSVHIVNAVIDSHNVAPSFRPNI